MPVPPCGAPAQPAFPDPGAPPNLQVWKDRAANAAWVPPSCTGWTEPGFRMLVALAASFQFDGDGKDLLGRLGAISALRRIQYWSASDQSWRVLITDAAALEGPSIKHRRPDFAATEMGIRKVVYFLQDDSRSSGPVGRLSTSGSGERSGAARRSDRKRFSGKHFHVDALPSGRSSVRVFFGSAVARALDPLQPVAHRPRRELTELGARGFVCEPGGRLLPPYRRHPDRSKPTDRLCFEIDEGVSGRSDCITSGMCRHRSEVSSRSRSE